MVQNNISSLIANFEVENFMCLQILFFEEFQLGRFFLKKISDQIGDDVVVYISNQSKVYKVMVSEFY